ncbi:MAG: NAD(P)-dependent oxidoreductase [Alphaproteobacteria bacterium]
MAIAMLNNNMPKYLTDQRQKVWAPVFATDNAGKTLAVIGLGAMCGAVARAGKSLGLLVIGIRLSGRPTRSVREVYGTAKLKQVLKRADFVVLTLPATPETHGLIDATALDAMKRGAGLINMAGPGCWIMAPWPPTCATAVWAVPFWMCTRPNRFPNQPGSGPCRT